MRACQYVLATAWRVLLTMLLANGLWLTGARAGPADDAAPAAKPEPSAPAAAQPVLDEVTRNCVSAFEKAQLLRRTGALLSSREQLRQCAQARCPAIIVEKCVPWLTEVKVEIPTIVIAARDPAGRDTVEVSVIVDGRKVMDKLDGRPIALDPGMRRVQLRYPDAFSITQKLLIVQGEKARRVVVRFKALPTAGGDSEAASVSPVAIVGWSVFGAAAVLGAITGGIALQRGDSMALRCPVDKVCSGQDDGVEEYYQQSQAIAHVSTVSFSVAGVAAVVGVIGLLLPTTSGEPGNGKQVAIGVGWGRLQLVGSF